MLRCIVLATLLCQRMATELAGTASAEDLPLELRRALLTFHSKPLKGRGADRHDRWTPGEDACILLQHVVASKTVAIRKVVLDGRTSSAIRNRYASVLQPEVVAVARAAQAKISGLAEAASNATSFASDDNIRLALLTSLRFQTGCDLPSRVRHGLVEWHLQKTHRSGWSIEDNARILSAHIAGEPTALARGDAHRRTDDACNRPPAVPS